MELYLTEIRCGSLMFVVCLVGVWQRNFEPMVCVKYLRDIRRVRQNTTLYYDVMCHRTDNMFRPFTIRPSSGLISRAKEEIVKL